MSVQAISWVLKQSSSKASNRCVLMSIANHIDASTGEGWAYVGQILSEANCSQDTYHRAIASLIDAGELEFDKQGGGTHRVRKAYRPNLYRLPMFLEHENRPPQIAGASEPQDAGASTPQSAGARGPQSAGAPIEEPSIEPSVVRAPDGARRERSSPTPYSERFLKFWETYPRKLAKKAAWGAWQATIRHQRASANELVEAGARYSRFCAEQGTHPKFVLHAATFLGPGDRWQDFLPAPSTGRAPIDDQSAGEFVRMPRYEDGA